MQSGSRKQSLIHRSVLPRHLCTVLISAMLVSFPDQYDTMFIAICTLYKQVRTCISLVFGMLNLRIRALIRNVALLLLTVHRYTLVVHLGSHFTHDRYITSRKNSGCDVKLANCIPYAVKGKGLFWSDVEAKLVDFYTNCGLPAIVHHKGVNAVAALMVEIMTFM